MIRSKVLTSVDERKLREWLTEANGHSVFAPRFFLNMGFSPAMVHRHSRVHRSNDGCKQYISMTGRAVKSLHGIWGLEFLWDLAESLGVNTSEANTKRGTGRQAKLLADAVLKVLDEPVGHKSPSLAD